MEIGRKMFIVSSPIMHEATHWGKWKYNCCEGEDNVYHKGSQFEEKAFGQRFTHRFPRIVDRNLNAFDEKVAIGYYNREKGKWGSPSFGFSINNHDKGSFLWKNRGIIKGGQKGDPTLRDNGDVEPDLKPFMPSNTFDTGKNKQSSSRTF